MMNMGWLLVGQMNNQMIERKCRYPICGPDFLTKSKRYYARKHGFQIPEIEFVNMDRVRYGDNGLGVIIDQVDDWE